MTPSFGILTISYARPQILRLFLANIKRLREQVCYFPCVCVGDAEHGDLCNEYFVNHVAMPNHPATAKWNRGIKYLRSLDLDYYIILGSDDIISNDLLVSLVKAMGEGYDLIGISTIYFYSAEGKRKGHLKKLYSHKQVLGVARTISKRVVDAVVGDLWSRPSSWGMDGICMKTIMPHVKSVKIVEGMAVDCKSSESLNRYSFWDGKIQVEETPQEFYNILSSEEIQILSEI
jgi:hypothetical protein